MLQLLERTVRLVPIPKLPSPESEWKNRRGGTHPVFGERRDDVVAKVDYVVRFGFRAGTTVTDRNAVVDIAPDERRRSVSRSGSGPGGGGGISPWTVRPSNWCAASSICGPVSFRQVAQCYELVLDTVYVGKSR
jgi:hypothetical protein